jgi:hypothetical protein
MRAGSCGRAGDEASKLRTQRRSQQGEGSQLWFNVSWARREGCRAPGSMGLSSSGSRGLLWAPVELLVRISTERGRSNSGKSCAGSFARTF